jgi:hypothetical protein
MVFSTAVVWNASQQSLEQAIRPLLNHSVQHRKHQERGLEWPVVREKSLAFDVLDRKTERWWSDSCFKAQTVPPENGNFAVRRNVSQKQALV